MIFASSLLEIRPETTSPWDRITGNIGFDVFSLVINPVGRRIVYGNPDARNAHSALYFQFNIPYVENIILYHMIQIIRYIVRSIILYIYKKEMK